MEISLNEVIVGWSDDEDAQVCPLCEYADDVGTAMDFVKKMDTALGGRTDDKVLAKMQHESYYAYFVEPMRKRNIEVPDISIEQFRTHFMQHDVNPLRQLRRDLNRLEKCQQALAPRQITPGGKVRGNECEMKMWHNLTRLKMDLMRQYEQTDNRRSRELPPVPDTL